MALHSALPTLSRYEALFELSSEINARGEIASVARQLARRLKYVVDVHSWRYVSLDEEASSSPSARRLVLVIDGHRGDATVGDVRVDDLSDEERELWRAKKPSFLRGDELDRARNVLPEHLRSESIVEIYVCPRLSAGEGRSVLLFSAQRQPFDSLDVKFLSLASQIFHDKVSRLWEGKKLRDLELAYLQQEITLRQSEKLATLGRLSAGMAHELNNPAAAAQRGAEQLRLDIESLEGALRRIAERGLTAPQSATLDKLLGLVRSRAVGPMELDPLARSDLESDIEAWLDDLGVRDAWEVAPTLAATGLQKDTLAELSEHWAGDQLAPIAQVLGSTFSARTLLEEIREGAGRISEIVKALKSYAYLDQAPVQSIDLREGLDDTLVMLRSRLGDGITVRRDYDPALPSIQAFGSELNQVWTNIIDNAITAMQGHGELALRTYRDGPWAVVEIRDTGSGIPEDVQSRVFDPFFTTKAPGEGTGLGLNISHNIVVQRHGGSIDVRSRPGETCFRVRLPPVPPAGSQES